MYEDLNAKLEVLSNRMNQVDSLGEELKKQEQLLNMAENRVELCQKNWEKEETDVDEMERRGIVQFFDKITGQYETKLSEELTQASTAKAQLDDAKAELESVRTGYYAVKREFDKCSGAKREYDELVSEKIARMKLEGAAMSESMAHSFSQVAELKNHIRQCELVIQEGNRVVVYLDDAIGHMETGSSYAKMDLVTNNYYLRAHKLEELAGAEGAIQNARSAMERFNKFMLEMDQKTLAVTGIDKVARTADVFFENIFSDYNTLNRLKKNSLSASVNKYNVEQVIAVIKAKKEVSEKLLAEEVAKLQEAAIKEV